jgi:hypothetical protein
VSVFLLSSLLLVPPPATLDTRPILDAIRAVETGGHPDPANAVGDSGAALGPYQIHRSYWLDATERNPALRALGYQSVRDQATAEAVAIAYFTRYAPAWDLRTVARIHNGGPRGHKKAATVRYADRVEEAAR